MGHQGTAVAAQTFTGDPSSPVGWFLLLGLALFMVIAAYLLWKSSK